LRRLCCFVLFFLDSAGASILMVSFWDYNEYEMLPAFTLQELPGELRGLRQPDVHELCVTLDNLSVHASSSACLVCGITLVIGFAVAYFLAFHVRSPRHADRAVRCCAPSRSGPPT
jgi:putative spermidine/putrescine transport system permease protein